MKSNSTRNRLKMSPSQQTAFRKMQPTGEVLTAPAQDVRGETSIVE
jgi:hypothetical protein